MDRWHAGLFTVTNIGFLESVVPISVLVPLGLFSRIEVPYARLVPLSSSRMAKDSEQRLKFLSPYEY